MSTARDEGFREYVVARRAGLVGTATLLTGGNPHLAEDLVQTVLSRIYVAWPRFSRVENPDGYARRMLVNALIDETRRPWRRERSVELLPERPTPADPASAVPSTPGRAESLMAALQQLPPRMRAALVFRYFHDLTVAETADALGCSQGTVKSQTARGLDKLRVVLGADLTTRDEPPPAPHRPAPHRPAPLDGSTTHPTSQLNSRKEHRHV